MKHKLLTAFAIAFSFTLGACSLGGNNASSAKPWGNTSAPVFGSSSQESTTTSSEVKTTCVVTYYVDKKVYATQEVKKGYQTERPEDPYKAGYAFKRWEDSNGRRWEFSIDCVWNDLDLYAVFEEGEFSSEPYDYFTVNFYVEGNLYYSQQVFGGSCATRPGDPYLSGYTFLGWRTEYDDMWDFSQSVYSNMNLYAVFEAERHHIITLYGDFTGWNLYNDYERKSGYGFPMTWEGIYLPASTAFGFHVLYDDGEEFDIGWGNLFANGCPYVTVATGNLHILVTSDVTLDFSIDASHKITITSWAVGPSSSESTYSSDSYYPSSSESTYSSGSSSSLSGAAFTLIVNRDNWTKTDKYERYESEGYPIVWEDIDFAVGDEFYITLQRPNSYTYSYGWVYLDDASAASGCFTKTSVGIQTMFAGTYSITFTQSSQIIVNGWESSSSSASSLEDIKEISNLSMHLYDANGNQNSVYPISPNTSSKELGGWRGYYIPENYSVFFQVNYKSGNSFVLTYNEIDPNREWGANYGDNGKLGVKFFYAGEYDFVLKDDFRVYIEGFEPEATSSASSYSSSDSLESSSLASTKITLSIVRTLEGKTDTYVREESEGYPIVYEDIDVIHGDIFFIEVERLNVVINHYDWASLDPASASSGVFYQTTDGIGVMAGGMFSFTFTSDQKIYVTGWESPSSSSASSSSYPSSSDSYYSSESYTTEESVTSEDFAPGYYLVCNDNGFTMNYDDVGYESTYECSLALWDNRYFDEGDYFAIRHKFDDGHTFDLGYAELIDSCQACDELGQYGSTYIAFTESGYYSILLLANESILVYHYGAETMYKMYTVNFYADGSLCFTTSVQKGLASAIPPAPDKEGYSFSHWQDANGNLYDGTTGIYEDLDLYAVYLQEFTVTLFYNYPAYSEYSTMTVVQNRSFTLPSLNAPVGLEFECWTYNNVDYPAGEYPSYDFGEGITFTAKYKDLYPLFEFDKSIQYVTGYNAEGYTSLVIPAGIRGYETLGIGSSAFTENQSLQTVALPSTIQTICANAFSNCPNLSSITFDGTLEEWASVVLGTCWVDGCPVTQIVCKDGVAAI